ncbi:hypothetical protein HG531_009718 [Fusarium graminearum]|nr:hypothetical protein HG531_009718 [Fusarium graminearum]
MQILPPERLSKPGEWKPVDVHGVALGLAVAIRLRLIIGLVTIQLLTKLALELLGGLIGGRRRAGRVCQASKETNNRHNRVIDLAEGKLSLLWAKHGQAIAGIEARTLLVYAYQRAQQSHPSHHQIVRDPQEVEESRHLSRAHRDQELMYKQTAFGEAVGAEIVLGLRVGVGVVTVVVYTSAVIAALVTMHLGNRGLGGILGTRNAVGGWGFTVCLALSFADERAFGIGLVDVSSNFEILLCFGRSGRSSLLVSVLALLALQNHRVS